MVHLYRNGGYNIVLDVESGSVHLVDELAFGLIPMLEDTIVSYAGKEGGCDAQAVADFAMTLPPSVGHDASEVRETVDEICSLFEEGRLYSRDVYKDYVEGFVNRPVVVKALCLHVAHDCNLSCRYCFAGEGEYRGSRELMSYETGRRALDFLIENSGSRKNLEVDFFGGEPLMNWDVVKALVEYGRSRQEEADKNFRFTLTTNGTLLREDILEFAGREMSNIVCSIDGRKEINDAMRPLRGGQGSYDIILPKFKRVARLRRQNDYYVRGTYTHFNTDFAKDVIHLMDEGFEQISVEPVVAPAKEAYALREEDIPILLEQYDILLEEIIKRRKAGKFVNFFHFMIDLEGGPCVAKRLSGCGAGGEYLAVTPGGDIYPCHQFVGMKDFLMGNVFEGIKNEELGKSFRSCSVYSKDACRSCFAKYYCSGGCMANAYNFSGDINGSYEMGCILQRKRVECAIALKAAMAE